MKKNTFIKATLILIIGGFITKILGMVIRIITTRLLGTTGIGLYSLIMPTFSLLIGLAQLGLPVAISTLVSQDKYNNKNLLFSALPITIIINLIIMLILFLFANNIATNLLNEPRVILALKTIGLVLPFISLSSIIRGYFFGKQKMLPHVLSNISEDIIRLVLMIIGIPICLLKGLEYAVAVMVLTNIVSETLSILVMLFFIPKTTISPKDIYPNTKYIKNILKIAIPSTGSRLIGNIGYFLEPIILTNTLLMVGYSNTYIIDNYGIINGYVLSILLLPSFFTLAISQALIPNISKAYINKQYKYVSTKIKQAIIFSLLIGIPFTIIIYLFPNNILNILYKTTLGSEYLKILSPFFLIYYIQAPLTATLQATMHAKEAFFDTLLGIIIRLSTLFILSTLKIGMWGLLIATLLSIYTTTIAHAIRIKRFLIRK